MKEPSENSAESDKVSTASSTSSGLHLDLGSSDETLSAVDIDLAVGSDSVKEERPSRKRKHSGENIQEDSAENEEKVVANGEEIAENVADAEPNFLFRANGPESFVPGEADFFKHCRLCCLFFNDQEVFEDHVAQECYMLKTMIPRPALELGLKKAKEIFNKDIRADTCYLCKELVAADCAENHFHYHDMMIQGHLPIYNISADKKYHCMVCDETYTDVVDICLHMELHARVVCEYCAVIFNPEQEDSHYRWHCKLLERAINCTSDHLQSLISRLEPYVKVQEQLTTMHFGFTGCNSCGAVLYYEDTVRHLQFHLESYRFGLEYQKDPQYPIFLPPVGLEDTDDALCRVCEQKFPADRMFVHQWQVHFHHGDKVVKCPLCLSKHTLETLEDHFVRETYAKRDIRERCQKDPNLAKEKLSSVAEIRADLTSDPPTDTTWKCPLCSFVVDAADIEDHLKMHETFYKTLKFTMDFQSFTTADDFVLCPFCDARMPLSTDTRRSVENHVRSHAYDRPLPEFKCFYCAALHGIKELHQQHIEQHLVDFKIRWAESYYRLHNESQTNLAKLKSFIADYKKLPETMVACPVCSENVPWRDMEYHYDHHAYMMRVKDAPLRIVDNGYPYTCPILPEECREIGTSVLGMHNHSVERHCPLVVHVQVPKVRGQTQFPCLFCGLKSPYRTMESHYKEIHGADLSKMPVIEVSGGKWYLLTLVLKPGAACPFCGEAPEQMLDHIENQHYYDMEFLRFPEAEKQETPELQPEKSKPKGTPKVRLVEKHASSKPAPVKLFEVDRAAVLANDREKFPMIARAYGSLLWSQRRKQLSHTLHSSYTTMREKKPARNVHAKAAAEAKWVENKGNLLREQDEYNYDGILQNLNDVTVPIMKTKKHIRPKMSEGTPVTLTELRPKSLKIVSYTHSVRIPEVGFKGKKYKVKATCDVHRRIFKLSDAEMDLAKGKLDAYLGADIHRANPHFDLPLRWPQNLTLAEEVAGDEGHKFERFAGVYCDFSTKLHKISHDPEEFLVTVGKLKVQTVAQVEPGIFKVTMVPESRISAEKLTVEQLRNVYFDNPLSLTRTEDAAAGLNLVSENFRKDFTVRNTFTADPILACFEIREETFWKEFAAKNVLSCGRPVTIADHQYFKAPTPDEVDLDILGSSNFLQYFDAVPGFTKMGSYVGFEWSVLGWMPAEFYLARTIFNHGPGQVAIYLVPRLQAEKFSSFLFDCAVRSGINCEDSYHHGEIAVNPRYVMAKGFSLQKVLLEPGHVLFVKEGSFMQVAYLGRSCLAMSHYLSLEWLYFGYMATSKCSCISRVNQFQISQEQYEMTLRIIKKMIQRSPNTVGISNSFYCLYCGDVFKNNSKLENHCVSYHLIPRLEDNAGMVRGLQRNSIAAAFLPLTHQAHVDDENPEGNDSDYSPEIGENPAMEVDGSEENPQENSENEEDSTAENGLEEED